MITILLSVLLATVTLTLIFGLLKTRALQPLRQLAKVMEKLDGGHTDVAIDCQERGDELGMKARSPDAFRANLIAKQRFEAEQEKTCRLLKVDCEEGRGSTFAAHLPKEALAMSAPSQAVLHVLLAE